MPPVDDHPVHEKTKIGSDFRYGCFNRKPFSAGYYAKDRVYRGNGTFYEVLVYIPHTMTTDCQFDMYEAHSACATCPHGGAYERV